MAGDGVHIGISGFSYAGWRGVFYPPALEVRHPSFRDPKFFALLREHEVALCIADTAKRYPDFDEVTADFVYVRLHGATKLYQSGYAHRTLMRWARRIEAWRARKENREVFVYFDNDAKVRAPFDARTLMEIVHGLPTRHRRQGPPTSSKSITPNEPFHVATR